MSSSTSWWQGEAGNALRDGYRETDGSISKLLTSMDRLRQCLENLARKVQQADEEKKRKEAEKNKG